PLGQKLGGDEGQEDLHDHLQGGQADAQERVSLVDPQPRQNVFHVLGTSLPLQCLHAERFFSIFFWSRSSVASSSWEKPWYSWSWARRKERSRNSRTSSPLPVPKRSLRRSSWAQGSTRT